MSPLFKGTLWGLYLSLPLWLTIYLLAHYIIHLL